MINFYHGFVLGWLLLLLAAGPCLAQHTTKHKVIKGETLFSIARKENVSVEQIKQWNDLSGNQLSVGQALIIKKKSASATLANGQTHTVEAGETLFSIARQYNVSVEQLKQWNELRGSHLSAGTRLRIRPSTSSSASSRQTEPNPTPQASGTYTVKSGDSLFRIARAHGMRVARIKEINGLSSNTIHVGQQLKLAPADRLPSLAEGGVKSTAQGKFVRYSVKKSQSKKALLKKFRMDETEFKALNPQVSATSFQKGDNLRLLVPANHTYKNPYLVNQSTKRLGKTTVIKYHKKTATPTTSGELYSPGALTAADGNMALGSVIYVKNPHNKRGVFVRVNDRTTRDELVVSDAVWQALGLAGSTHGRVTMYRIDE